MWLDEHNNTGIAKAHSHKEGESVACCTKLITQRAFTWIIATVRHTSNQVCGVVSDIISMTHKSPKHQSQWILTNIFHTLLCLLHTSGLQNWEILWSKMSSRNWNRKNKGSIWSKKVIVADLSSAANIFISVRVLSPPGESLTLSCGHAQAWGCG